MSPEAPAPAGPARPISGTTRVAAVIGDPVSHSRSPAILNAAFAAAGLDWVFTAFRIPGGRSGDAVRSMRDLDLGGLSVTMPLKAEVLDHLDAPTAGAERLGAVNCIAWDRGHLVGHNTDGEGLLTALRLDGFEAAGRHAVVLGAGGAARAVVLALVGAGASRVSVWNRSVGRAAAPRSWGRSSGSSRVPPTAPSWPQPSGKPTCS
ncbi:MAG: hypothetical protein R2716_03635 [Microthrixaceae bacterium]